MAKSMNGSYPVLLKTIKTPFSLFYSTFRDMKRFWSAAHLSSPDKNRKTAQAHMLRLAHALEKGMAMPVPRPAFGMNKTSELITFLRLYLSKWDVDHEVIIATQSVRSLLNFHHERGAPQPEAIKALQALEAAYPALTAGLDGDSVPYAGNRRLSKDEVLNSLPPDPEAFFFNRQSVRQFGPAAELDKDDLLRAVRLAQRAPSVCNRQSGRVYIYTEPDAIKRVLSYQDGNGGFGDSASAIIVCTADLSCFYKPGERNQGFVDGGLFAMSLVYALHSLGYGSCMLNWSQPIHKDDPFRKASGIPDNEVIITMIAAGPLRDAFDVANSPRRLVSEITHWNPPLKS